MLSHKKDPAEIDRLIQRLLIEELIDVHTAAMAYSTLRDPEGDRDAADDMNDE